MTHLRCFGPLLLALCIAGSAAAQGRRTYGSDLPTADTWPDEVIRRPLTLADGLGELSVPVVLNLTTDQVAKPVFIPARLSYGVTDAVTLSVIHAVGLCLTGTSNGCPKAYNDVGVEGLFALVPSGAFQVALAAAFLVPSISEPFAMAAGVGFATRYTAGPLALRIDPQVTFGLNERDAGNRETLAVPVTLQLQLTPNLLFAVGSGVFGLLDPLLGSFSDNYTIPLGFTAALTTSRLDLGAQFTFLNVRGSAGSSATDLRIGQVFAALRL
ncbi:MAG TPA: hypothetical protein VE755_00105 [Myxococcales bacterium]|nr:hypothetical protein [Myxococcales bacterium]